MDVDVQLDHCVSRVLMAAVMTAALMVPGSAGAGPCAPRAALEGAPSLTMPIARELRAHGVALVGDAACAGRTVRAVVTSAAPARGYKLHIDDGFGRSSDRVIAKPETAVSLIESWVVDENADLLTISPGQANVTPTISATATAPVAATALRLYAGLATALGTDQSAWGGATLGACAQVGPFCAGAKANVARDLELGGEAAEAGGSRTNADVLAMAGWPLTRGRALVMPALGLGVGWMRTYVPAEDSTTPAQTSNTFGVRASASVLVGIEVSRHIGLALDLGGTFAPTARPTPADESMSSTSSLPGEPRALFQAALACVVSP